MKDLRKAKDRAGHNSITLTMCAHVLKVYLIISDDLARIRIYLSVTLKTLREQFCYQREAFLCLAHSGFIPMSLLFFFPFFFSLQSKAL